MTTPAFEPMVQRPHTHPHARLAGLLVLIGAGAVVAGAAGATLGEPATPLVVSVISPVMPPAPAPTVVTQLMPAPPAPEPEPPPEPPPVRPRATTPLVNADCMLLADGVEPPRACAWDQGFPAISADGTQIAMWAGDDDPSGEGAGARIAVLDVASSRTVRTLRVSTTEEVIAVRDAAVPTDARAYAKVERMRATVRRRAAAAQRVLDAGGYRAMDMLGARGEQSGVTDDADATRVHAEIDGELVRAIDPATQRVLWQQRFSTPAPRTLDPDDDCGGWSLAWTSAWWDPATRTALVSQTYHMGGCMCGEAQVEHVRRMR